MSENEPVADRFTPAWTEEKFMAYRTRIATEGAGVGGVYSLWIEAYRARSREAELEAKITVLLAAGQALFTATEAFESYLCDNGDRQNAYNTSTNAQEAWLVALEGK